ncbi:hypothetical protein DYE49_00310 [Treponema rectale]|uniref:Uncharacterized protein n=1 Tax=Treponema rectale TaxID=744512 RepID=A0A7M1XJM9_9SPIR|nr:hypothetical protein DYE49_00310 [Treponema rectale]
MRKNFHLLSSVDIQPGIKKREKRADVSIIGSRLIISFLSIRDNLVSQSKLCKYIKIWEEFKSFFKFRASTPFLG